MSLEQQLEANTAALIALTAALTNAKQPAAAPAPAAANTPAAPKGRKAAPAAPAPEPTPAAAPEPAAATAPTYEETAKAVTALVAAKGRAVAVEVLAGFGAARLFDVKPEQFAEVIAKCQALMADAPIV